MSDRETKEKIKSAVQELLSAGCPVGDITVRKIAQLAGVGIGTVSYHYHSKDKLVYEVIAEQMANLAEKLTPSENTGTPSERLKSFFYQTTELALQYQEIFRVQLSYEILNGDMSICYYVLPLLREHFNGSKTDPEIKVIALEIITAMQMILLRMDEFQRYSEMNMKDRKHREEVLDIIINSAII